MGVGPAGRLAIVVLATDDLDRSVTFYQGLTGWARAVDTPVFVELAGDGARLALYDVRSYAANLDGATPDVEVLPPAVAAPDRTGVNRTELYLEVPDAEDAVARAIVLGARLLSPVRPRSWGQPVGYVMDPDGTVIGLAGPAVSASGSS
jgi:catechol 2,3-dioxygenase-like lactoylglutathione lyase family enzyme